MNWNDYLLYMIFMTGLTGSIWSVIWLLVCQIVKKYCSSRTIYKYQKILIAGYCLPVVFLAELIHLRAADYTVGFLFTVTPSMEKVLDIVFWVWAGGAAACLLVFFVKALRLYWEYRKGIPVSIKDKALLQQTCEKLGIKEEVRVCRNYNVASPFIFGIRKPCIYLPVYDCSETELEMVFSHELMHYKQGDVFWKPFFCLLCCLYWFNPLIWVSMYWFQKWSEASCDESCCEDFYCSREYFQTIYKLMEEITDGGEQWEQDEKKNRNRTTLTSNWYNNENELRWRVKTMKSPQKIVKKGISIAITTMIVLVSGVSTYGAELGAKKAYDCVYMNTMEGLEEVNTPSTEYEEYVMDIDDLEGIEIIEAGEGNEDAQTMVIDTVGTIGWTIRSGNGVKSSAFYEPSSGSVIIAVKITPANKEVKVGIVGEDNLFHYVKGQGSIAHTFSVPAAGNYRVYIINESDTTVTASGCYVF